MEIVYVYTKKRAEFGRQCMFSDRPAELHVDIAPDPAMLENFIVKNPVDHAVQHSQEMSEHEINTERYQSDNDGVNHAEGGWPKDVNAAEQEQVVRYRKKVEKDDYYINSIKSLSNTVEHVVLQNNAINIYQEYWAGCDDTEVCEPNMKTINVFRDPCEIKRMASHISWYPESPTKLAVAYCCLEFQQASSSMATESYIWDVESPNKPDFVFRPSSRLCCIEFNPKDSHILIGGCENGQIAYWDTRKGSQPVETTPIECSHRDAPYKVLWVQSKTGTEAFSASTDGLVLWWDTRKFSEPVEKMVMDLSVRKQEPTSAAPLSGGVSVLEYEPTIPTKFMVGTEDGVIVSCNRKGKTPAEKIVSMYQGHIGPIRSLQRNFFFPKIFLSAADWSARIWTEEVRDSQIIRSFDYKERLTDSAWSPARPAVFFTTKMDGTLDVWDISSKQKGPVLTMQVCDEPLQSIRVHEGGQLIACGSQNGTVNILELNDTLCTMQPSEKNIASAIIERETRREKILEARTREMKLKDKTAKGDADGEAAPVDVEKNRDDLIQQATEEFWKIMDQDKKLRQKEQAERERNREDQESEEKADQENGEKQGENGEAHEEENEGGEQAQTGGEENQE